MDTDLIVGLLGAVATIVAAFIGAYAIKRSGRSEKEGELSQGSEIQLSYSIHRLELERKEKEVRDLLNTVLLYRQQAKLVGEELAKANRYRDNLTDFFENVTEKRKLELEIAVRPNGETAIFYNKKLKVSLTSIEYYTGEKGIVFKAGTGSRRPIGLPLTDEVADLIALHRPRNVVLIYIDEMSGKAIEGVYFPLHIYDPPGCTLSVGDSMSQ